MKKGRLKKLLVPLVLSLMLICQTVMPVGLAATTFPEDGGSFNFAGNYEAPELTIDGKANDEKWDQTDWLVSSFGVAPNSDNGIAKVKVYRGAHALFFYFEVEDACLLTEGTTNDDKVTRSDSIELYINTMESIDKCSGYQINLAIHGKARILQGTGKMTEGWSPKWGDWNGLIDYEFDLKGGTLNNGTAKNDTGYSAEVMVPYSQIGAEKESVLGIALGRVDKWGSGTSSKTDWDWYGWTYNTKAVDPQVPTSYVCLNGDGTLTDQDSLPKPPAALKGTITDSVTHEPIAGVQIKSGDSVVTTTNASGEYAIGDLDPEYNREYSLEKTGYFNTNIAVTRAELRAANGGVVTKNTDMINIALADKTTITGTVKNVINGVVEGATISVKNTTLTATTGADGTFSLADMPVTGGATLVVSKAGYADETITKAENQFAVNSTTALGDINLSLAYNTASPAIGGARGSNAFDLRMTRTLTGLRFKLSTVTLFEAPEAVILYLHAGTVGTNATVNSTWDSYKPMGMKFFGDGTIGFDKTGTYWYKTTPVAGDINYSVNGLGDPNGATLLIDIPFTFMNKLRTSGSMTATDVFSVTGGSACYENGSNLGWDGTSWSWTLEPDQPKTWIRVDRYNNLYQADHNNQMVTVSGTLTGISSTLIEGATVTLDSPATTVTTNGSGDYSISLQTPSATRTLTYKANGYLWDTATFAAADYNSAANQLNHTINKTLTQRLNTVTGKVVDADGLPIANAGISVVANSLEVGTATTAADGTYTVANVPSFYDISIVASHNDFNDGTTSITRAAQNAIAAATTLSASDITMTGDLITISGAVINLFGEAIQGATVTVAGQAVSPATTDASGEFTIENVGLANLTLTIEKSGYLTETVKVAKGSLSTLGENDLGDLDIKLPYGETGVFGKTANSGTNFSGFVTRGRDELQFYFTSTVTGNFNVAARYINLYVSTGSTGSALAAGDYIFKLDGAGDITVTSYGATATNIATTGMVYDIAMDPSGTYVTFKLPYAFFGNVASYEIAATDTIGISLGEYAVSESTWTYNYAGQTQDSAVTVSKADTRDFIRISKENMLFWSAQNVDISAAANAPIRFGTVAEGAGSGLNKSDNFYANASRDTTDLIFDFTTYGNFASTDVVLLIIDVPPVKASAGGWVLGAEDYVIKIYGTGTVGYKTGITDFWAAQNATQDTGNLTSVSTASVAGVTSFQVKVPYSLLSITASTAVGFAMREASFAATTIGLYDPWFDCFFNPDVNATTASASRWVGYALNGANGTDAAATKEFIQIAADGTLSRDPIVRT